MDAVERGETVLVTRNGTPVAELRPLLPQRTSVPASELLRVFATLPRMDAGKLRADLDAFDEDTIDG